MRFSRKHDCNLILHTEMKRKRSQTIWPARRHSPKAWPGNQREPQSPVGSVDDRGGRWTKGWPAIRKPRFLLVSLRWDSYTLQLQRGHQTQRTTGGVKCTLAAPTWHRASEDGATRTGGEMTEKKNKKGGYMNMSGARKLAPVVPWNER